MVLFNPVLIEPRSRNVDGVFGACPVVFVFLNTISARFGVQNHDMYYSSTSLTTATRCPSSLLE